MTGYLCLVSSRFLVEAPPNPPLSLYSLESERGKHQVADWGCQGGPSGPV